MTHYTYILLCFKIKMNVFTKLIRQVYLHNKKTEKK